MDRCGVSCECKCVTDTGTATACRGLFAGLVFRSYVNSPDESPADSMRSDEVFGVSRIVKKEKTRKKLGTTRCITRTFIAPRYNASFMHAP